MRNFRRMQLRTTNVAQARLQAIIGNRPQVPQDSAPTQILYEPPATAIRPLAKIAAGSIAAIACLVWMNRPQSVATPEVQVTGLPVESSSAPAQSFGEIVVDVEGTVSAPGLKTLPSGSRVADAIAAAGGLSEATPPGTLNLAQRVTDGQLIVIGAAAASAPATDSRVNLNSATIAELDSLPGVGPVMAGRIIAWRDAHQHFSAIEELQEVPGIGPKVFANLKDLIRI